MISFEKYFRNCFNLKAKPDFQKVPGPSTEHCEQFVRLADIDLDMADNFTLEAIKGMRWLGDMQKARSGWLKDLFDKDSEGMKAMLPKVGGGDAGGTETGITWEMILADSTSSPLLALGPSGSGEQMRQEGRDFVDGLIHGRRRWLFIDPIPFNKLRESAKEVLEPASAFMFFEQQLGELVEDYGLGERNKAYFECNQEPGDLLFVPGSLVGVSLNLEDSISYFEHLVTSGRAARQRVDSELWNPASGQVPDGFNAVVCFGWNFDQATAKLGGPSLGMQAQLIGQIMQQSFAPTLQHENLIMIKAMAECQAAIGAPGVNAARTVCSELWSKCYNQLNYNAGQLGISLPSAIQQTVHVVDTGEEDGGPELQQRRAGANGAKKKKKKPAPAKGDKGKKKQKTTKSEL